MEENIIVDNVNIKTLPEIIVNFLRGNSKIDSVRMVYSIILEEISEDVKLSYLNRIQKYLSSSEESTILIFEDINNKIYDKELKKAINIIYKEIIKNKNYSLLFLELKNKCYFIHFEEKELEKINNLFRCKNYEELLFLLFKHAIKNYKTNTPKILAERIYNEASTMVSDPLKKNLYKISGDLGNSKAALEYATTIKNSSISLKYFLKAKDLNESLWFIGFYFEKNKVTKEEYEIVKKELKDIYNIAKEYEEFRNIVPYKRKNNFEKDCLKFAFKIYLFLAKEKNYSKAFNSLGKLLLNNIIVYADENNNYNYEYTKNLGINYLKKAISLSNIHAMQNLAIYYKKTDSNNPNIKPLLLVGAKNEYLLSCVELAEVLIEENNIDDAMHYLEFASNMNNTYAIYNLGKIYENKYELNKAKDYYKKAVSLGLTKASIDLAILYFHKYVDSNENNRNSYLLYAIDILNNNLHLYDAKEKENAIFLINEWNKILKGL